MSKFTQSEETMIVNNAMELTATIMLENQKLGQAKTETFRALPGPPVRNVLPGPGMIHPQYPPRPKTAYSYTEYVRDTVEGYKKYFIPTGIAAVIIFILGSMVFGSAFVALLVFAFGFCIFPALVISYYLYYTKRKNINQQLAAAPEYLQAVEEAERAARKQQEEAEERVRQEQEKADAEYEKQKKQYETITVPEYKEALQVWKGVQERKIAFLEEELEYNNEALKELYDNSKLISATYRELWILKWLYEDMSTSDHDIRYATELLDRDRQRLATQEAGKRTKAAIQEMNGMMMSGFHAVYNAIEYGNDLQEDSIEILSRARRDNNIGNLVGTAQRHHTNKMLKSLLAK